MNNLKKSILIIVIAAVTTLFPVTALADTQPTTPPSEPSAVTATPADPAAMPTTTTPVPVVTTPTTDPAPVTTTPAPATPGPQAPTGADAKKFHLNPATGKYENDYYVWDPITKQTSPKNASTYSYNPATGMWDTTAWAYDAASGTYKPNIASTTVTPPASQQTGVAPVSQAALLNGGSNTLGANLASVGGTGPDSKNTINNTSNNTGNFNLFYNAAISNNIYSNASTGNAILTGNTTAGNSTTGNALSMANIINMLQSTWSPLSNGNFNTFNATIAGDVTGDLHVDPGATGPGSTQVINNTTNNDLTVKAQAAGTINNNVALSAVSGNALVADNTKGGNATTGNASAMANIVNAISSSIAAGKSFLGTINITGNLNGDILLPDGLLSSLIAATGPDSTSTINNNKTTNTTANLTDTQLINNKVNANATSGTAGVTGNTKAGSATTGDATTKVNILNLTGKQVIGKDALLVFVNVLGKWTGLIVNAPAGATSAALGGGLTQNNTLNANTNVDSTNTNTINNNVNVNAASGDASVNHNTTGGNATSGNAIAGANIANITNSNLSFSDWFGVLFINVFGSWTGSFGVDTAAGNPPIASNSSSSASAPASAAPQVLRFTPKAAAVATAAKVALTGTDNSTDTSAGAQDGTQQQAAVLGDSDTNGTPTSSTGSASTSHQLSLTWVPFAGSGLGLLILAGSEISSRRHKAMTHA